MKTEINLQLSQFSVTQRSTLPKAIVHVGDVKLLYCHAQTTLANIYAHLIVDPSSRRLAVASIGGC